MPLSPYGNTLPFPQTKPPAPPAVPPVAGPSAGTAPAIDPVSGAAVGVNRDDSLKLRQADRYDTNPATGQATGVAPGANYYGQKADGSGLIERLGTPAPLDPNAFGIQGLPFLNTQYQGAIQRAQGLQTGAIQDIYGQRANAAQSRALALQALTQPGPSIAEAQLRMGQDAAAQNALAMARSGRGLGSGGMLRAASFAGQEGMAQANQQAALIRAQEEANRRQQLLALTGQDLGALGQAGQQALGFGGQGLQATTMQAGLAQAQQQQLAEKAKLDAGMALDVNKTNANYANYDQPTQDNTWTDVANATGAIGGGISGIAGLATALAGLGLFSDERSKTKIRDLEAENAALRGVTAPATSTPPPTAADRLAAIPSIQYEYKNPSAPGAAPGEQIGQTAQAVERVLPGAVMDTAQGKMIDVPRLAVATTAATSELARRLKALEEATGATSLGQLPAMQVDMPRRQDLGTLAPMQIEVPR